MGDGGGRGGVGDDGRGDQVQVSGGAEHTLHTEPPLQPTVHRFPKAKFILLKLYVFY